MFRKRSRTRSLAFKRKRNMTRQYRKKKSRGYPKKTNYRGM